MGAALDSQGHSRVRASGIAAHVRAGAASFSCVVEELSRVGAFLRTDQRVAAGAALELDLVKPGGRKPVHIRGQVSQAVTGTGAEHPGLEVAFTAIAADDAQRLIAWFDELRSRGGEKEMQQAVPAAREKEVQQPAPIAGDEERARLMMQIKGLIAENEDLRDDVRHRDTEIEELRQQLATAEQLIGRQPKG